MNKKLIDIGAQFGSQFSTMAIGISLTPVAARHLENPKEDFGVWAILLVITGFGSLFASGSLESFAIRTDHLSPQRKSSLFLLTLMFSVTAGTILVACSKPVCQWMGISQWAYGLMVMAVWFVPMTLQSVACAILRKEKRFVTMMLVDVVRSILVISGTSYFLVSGFGLWSYIYVNLAASILVAFAAICLIGYPRSPCDWAYLKEGLRYCAGMTGFTSINYWSRNLDNVLIGRFFGSGLLGVYANAYRIMFLPTTAVNSAFQSLLLPYLAPHHDNPDKLLKHFLSSLQTLGLITIPAMTFLWLARYEIVEFYLGTGWDDCAKLLSVLMPIGMLQTLLSPLGICYQISGKTGTQFKLGLFNTCLIVSGFLIGIQYNLITFVSIYAGVNLVLLYPITAIGLGTIGGRSRDWAFAMAPLLAVPIVAAGIVMIAEPVTDQRLVVVALAVATTTFVIAIKFMPRTLEFARNQLGWSNKPKSAQAGARIA